MTEMTPKELLLLDKIGDVWNGFAELPEEHNDDSRDFRYFIHRLQDMVAARAAYRQLKRRD